MTKAVQLAAWSAELERLARVLNRVGPDEVCCESLTPRQCGILRTLVDKQGARLSDLAAESRITPSAMTRVLEKLEAHGLIQRVRGAGEDGRAAMVAITERGRTVRARIDQLMLDRTRTILRGIPAGFRPQLLAGIRALTEALGSESCCDLAGQSPELGVSRGPVPNHQSTQRRKEHARQGN